MRLWHAAHSWRRSHPRHMDSFWAVAVALVSVLYVVLVDVSDVSHDPPYRSTDALAVVLTLAYFAPMQLRRSNPILALSLTTLIGMAVDLPHYPDIGSAITGMCCVYSVAAYCPLARAGIAVAAIGAVNLGLIPVTDQKDPLQTLIFLAAIIAITFLVGRNVQTRRAYLAALEERARRAESERESTARNAVLDERRRIARELHDLVAHNVSVMRVLADGSRRLVRHDPDRAADALGQIDSAGREALREMRRILDVLRSDDEPLDSPTAPSPGTASVPQLVEQVRQAGLPVDIRVIGDPRPLPASTDLSAYRIVQEALTNTLKHGGPTALAHVELRYGAERLEIHVEDNGYGATAVVARADGHGLLGMRERVGVYGGQLVAGPRVGGGFAVRATLPYDVETAR